MLIAGPECRAAVPRCSGECPSRLRWRPRGPPLMTPVAPPNHRLGGTRPAPWSRRQDTTLAARTRPAVGRRAAAVRVRPPNGQPRAALGRRRGEDICTHAQGAERSGQPSARPVLWVRAPAGGLRASRVRAVGCVAVMRAAPPDGASRVGSGARSYWTANTPGKTSHMERSRAGRNRPLQGQARRRPAQRTKAGTAISPASDAAWRS